MAIRALHSAATGMEANQFNLDTIANNLANAGTTAFKRTQANFEDLFYENLKIPGLQDSNGQITPLGSSVGLGTRLSSTAIDFRPGNMVETGKPLDVAITGNGFFQLDDGTGQIIYSRAGTFTQNSDGAIVMASADRGRFLQPQITIPPGATSISISGTGEVSAIIPPQTEATQIDTIQTVTFINSEGLLRLGENLYAETLASGTPIPGNPGTDGRGSLKSGFLEASNVEPVRELIELIKTQRNFEINSQVVQAADQALQLIANLRRF